MALTKASEKITFSRDVFVSGFPSRAAGPLVEPVVSRIRNYLDDSDNVHSRKENWDMGPLRECLETVTDFILLYDDEVGEALRDADRQALPDMPADGLELLVVLGANETKRVAGEKEIRVWLAKTQKLPVRLRRVAKCDTWQLLEEDDGLHWLYDKNEKVLTKLENLQEETLLGDDETRLGERVEVFVDHEPEVCKRCGAVHPPP